MGLMQKKRQNKQNAIEVSNRELMASIWLQRLLTRINLGGQKRCMSVGINMLVHTGTILIFVPQES